MSFTAGNCTWIDLPLDISVHHSTEWKNIFSVIYGVIPPIWVFFCIIVTLITRRVKWFLLLTFALYMTVIQQILTKAIAQTRPDGTCCKLPCPQGMPSGHALHDVGNFCYWTFEIITNAYIFPKTIYPWWKKGLLITVVGLIWAPGIPSRVYVYDHSILQVVVGGTLGLFLALTFITFIFLYFRPKGLTKLLNSKYVKRIKINNDYYLSAQEVERLGSPKLINATDFPDHEQNKDEENENANGNNKHTKQVSNDVELEEGKKTLIHPRPAEGA